ncbi:uncharacterized protein N7483_010497 [Penicillium malachiteum]|uniref:uncharacterized protein n=1 Tax=Penicillium malachiteum TaxID=1324776 RepID=UPI0025493CDD|nr:uncharacterized protein N7483_010497 [Penicillium malachiteum]KAJ5713316.1 hypothetical protein N7483_010497 [Penicillium malachiteum]
MIPRAAKTEAGLQFDGDNNDEIVDNESNSVVKITDRVTRMSLSKYGLYGLPSTIWSGMA